MLIDGKKIALEKRAYLQELIQKHQGRKPGLAFILIGHDPASLAYVKMKSIACDEVGIHSHVFHLDHNIQQAELISLISKLNHDQAIDGILVQQPTPSHLDSNAILCAVDPKKDVDGFHPLNIGKVMMQDDEGFIPCTPLGILKLIEAYEIPTQGKHIVVLGRSLIVGRPIANLLSQKSSLGNATVTICHAKTDHLKTYTKTADILIAAMGKPHFINADYLKPDCYVIDVGINRIVEDGKTKIVGDVDFASSSKVAKMITPVPGGVGPMTIAMLLENTYKSYKRAQKI
jgi:methylenetetrahydrofolate dehydrogenase (NADP+)/methenyltetrahydrofolate cyclohydrolase